MIDESAFHMLLSLEHFMDSHSDDIRYFVRSKKQLDNLYRSLFKLPLTDYNARSLFLAYGGEVDVITDKDGNVTSIKME